MSSVLCDAPWFQLKLRDEGDVADVDSYSVGWDVPLLAKHFNEQAKILAPQYYEREQIKDYEMDKFRLELVDTYYNAMRKCYAAIVTQCDKLNSISCTWHYCFLNGNPTVVKKTKTEDGHDIF